MFEKKVEDTDFKKIFKGKEIFFGWWTVLATAIMSAWGYGSWFYGFGTYFKPLQSDFNWTRAQVSSAFSMSRLEGGVEGPFGGYLTDKYGPRVINFSGMLMAGTGLCLMYFMSSLWQYILIWGFLVSLGFNLGLIDPLEKALSEWFVKKRGLAIGLGRVGLAIGGGVVPQFMTFLLIQYGWRRAFLIAGLITWVIGLPLTWTCVKPHRPEYYGFLPDGEKLENKDDIQSVVKAGQEYAKEVGEVEFTLRQAIRTRAFWILFIYNLFYAFFMAAISVHQIPYLTDKGMDPIVAAGILGLMVFMTAPGRLVGGILSDRLSIHRMKYMLIIAYSLQALGMMFFIKATSHLMLYAFTLLSGFGGGIGYTSRALLRGRYFGRKAFASIYGTIVMVALPGNIIAPIYIGWVYDVTNSYLSAFTQSLILLIIIIVAFFFLKPPKPPAKITDINKFI